MLPFLEIKHLDKTYADLFSAIRERKKINVLSMTESARPHAAAVLGRFVLYVARDRASAELARERLSRFFSERTLVLRPKDDFLLFKRGVSGVLTERAEVLKELAYGTAGALVISAESLMERFPKKKLFCEFSVRLASGEDYDLYEAASRLTAAGYTRVERISAVGEFSVRGDILDVFYAEKSAVRVNFFGDTVESVRKIDPESMIGIRELKEIVLAPFSEILINPDQIPLVSERIGRQDIPKGADRLRITGVRENALIRLSGGSYAGFDWILPFLPENTSDIFEWLPRDAVVLIDEPNTVHERVKGYYKEFYDRVAGLVRSGEIFPCHKDAALAEESYAAGLKAFSAVSFLSISSYNPYYIPEETIGMPSVKLPSYYNDFNLLLGDIRSFLKLGKRVALCAGDRDKREILYRNLCDKMSRVTKSDGADGDFSGAVVLPCQIGEGFSIEKSGLVVIGESELFKKEKRVIRTNKSEAGYIPSAGDFVVHDVHGIGKFVGIERVKTGDLVRDYGRVIYREDQVLFIPVENLDKLIRYTGGGEPKLSKMGGAEFAKVKESVRRSVKELAFSLTELYRSREKTEGYIYSPDTEWQREFEESFEFDETEDQLTAVAEIKNDLESGKIMDRLLCGDVGYGKTEVALRAIFKVVTDGKQAAILAPTTILVRQHYNTILARTKDFKFNVGVLSRFESREEIAKTLTELKEGKLNIVVATHRLLSSDVNFYDLGLLVLDEEQRFGVEHKEKIKTIKNDVNVLTLSATPIPRTLHMALSGIRDISLLATPPQNRIPVETYVVEYSEGLVKDAVLREKGRGGQTFILYNRVESIDSFAYGISKLFNEEDNVRITVAHGQMSGAALDDKMTAFYNGEADLLICTTIIENGLDLPNANTIIIYDADKLGLATLYQLRGRVGRSGLVAHAYFTYKSGRVLGENAMKRLNAIMDYTDFGSGYKLAMRDLEIRGAGNILGAEQHGHMEKVGYEMYSRMLRQAVGALRGEVEVKKETEVRIQTDLVTYIDDSYAAGERKIEVYSRLAALDSKEKKAKYLAELTDTLGAPPESVLNLAEIALAKNIAAQFDAERILVNDKGLGVIFNKAFVKNTKLIQAIARDKSVLLAGDAKTPTLLFRVKNMSVREKLERIEGFFEKLKVES